MSKEIILQDTSTNSIARIDEGELVGFSVNGKEWIHQKGAPGWGNSDTEMFPVIGPTAQNNYEIDTARGVSIMDQHGLLRELDYKMVSRSEDRVEFIKEYSKNTKVRNSKFPKRSPIEKLYWPYDFKFRKTFILSGIELQIVFEIEGEENMPYMLGYHPAFKLSGTGRDSIQVNNMTIDLEKVLSVGSRALHVPDSEFVVLNTGKDEALTISTKGFGQFMLWTEVNNMLCIEPITFYPYGDDISQGFNTISKGEKAKYQTILSPKEL